MRGMELPEINKLVKAKDKDGNICFTFRTENVTHNGVWSFKLSDENDVKKEFVPVEWEYVDVKKADGCPIVNAMKDFIENGLEQENI